MDLLGVTLRLHPWEPARHSSQSLSPGNPGSLAVRPRRTPWTTPRPRIWAAKTRPCSPGGSQVYSVSQAAGQRAGHTPQPPGTTPHLTAAPGQVGAQGHKGSSLEESWELSLLLTQAGRGSRGRTRFAAPPDPRGPHPRGSSTTQTEPKSAAVTNCSPRPPAPSSPCTPGSGEWTARKTSHTEATLRKLRLLHFS